MKILDLASIRRAYIMHKACRIAGVEYRFHIHSGRKSISQDQSQLAELGQRAPYVLEDVSSDLFKEADSSDFLLVNSFIHSKETAPEFQQLVNRFRGKIISIDYAWDTYRKDIPVSNGVFKGKYSGIAIAVDYTSSRIRPIFNWSQPELDMSVHQNEFPAVTGQTGDNDGVFLLTPGRHFADSDILVRCIKTIQKHCSNPFIYLKFKQKDEPQSISHGRRTLRRMNIQHHISDESHKGLVNYCVLYALESHAHINLDPQSFSNLEVMRCGVPTFEFDGKDLTLPRYYTSALQRFWTQQSIEDVYDHTDLSKKKRAMLSVGPLHCAENLIRYLRGIL